MGFIKSLFTGKKAEPRDPAHSSILDYRAYEVGESTLDHLNQLQAYSKKEGAIDAFTMQVAFIFRLQQDVYRHFGVNIVTPDRYWSTKEGVALYLKAFEFLETSTAGLHAELNASRRPAMPTWVPPSA